MKLLIKDIEKITGYKLKRNSFILAFDTATKTGIAKITTTDKKLILTTELMRVPAIPKDTENKAIKYEEALGILLIMIREFRKTLKEKSQETILVLENSYLGFNPETYGFLKGFMGLIYAELYDYFENILILYPSAARKRAGFKSKIPRKHGMTAGKARIARKQEIMDFINNIFKSDIKDDNEADAIILGLAGLRKDYVND